MKEACQHVVYEGSVKAGPIPYNIRSTQQYSCPQQRLMQTAPIQLNAGEENRNLVQ